MAGKYDVSGIEGDIRYKVVQLKERQFMVTVSKGLAVYTELYNCEFPTLFGLDGVDHAGINKLLDELIEKVTE